MNLFHFLSFLLILPLTTLFAQSEIPSVEKSIQSLLTPELNAEHVKIGLDRFTVLQKKAFDQQSQIYWQNVELIPSFKKIETVLGSSVIQVNLKNKAQITVAQETWVPLCSHLQPLTSLLVNDQLTPFQFYGNHYGIKLNIGASRIEYDCQSNVQQLDNAQVAVFNLPSFDQANILLTEIDFKLLPLAQITAGVNTFRNEGALMFIWELNQNTAAVQQANFDVTLDQEQLGAFVKLDLDVNTYRPLESIKFATSTVALLDLKLYQISDDMVKREIQRPRLELQQGWHSVRIEEAGTYKIEARWKANIDRTNGQPEVSISTLSVPKSHLHAKIPGQRTALVSPNILSSTQYVENGEQSDTVIDADLPVIDTIVLSWTEKQGTLEEESAQYLTETTQLFTLQEGLLKSEILAKVDVIKGLVENIVFAIPEDAVLYQIEGAEIKRWNTLTAQDGAPRRVMIEFEQPIAEAFSLKLRLQKVLNVGESTVTPLIYPLNAFQQSGVIAFVDGENIGFDPIKLNDQYHQVGQEAIDSELIEVLQGEKVNQAFRHIQAPSTFEIKISQGKVRELRFDAQVDSLYHVREGAIHLKSQILISLKSGRSDKFTISIPKELAEPRITAPSLNKVEPIENTATQGLKSYQISFTRKLEGSFHIDFESELLFNKEQNLLNLPMISIQNAELENGNIGISAENGLELKEAQNQELRRIAIEELPKSIKHRDKVELLFAYKYNRAPWKLSVNLSRHKLVEQLDASGNNLKISTVLLDNQRIVHWVELDVDNQDKHDLRLQLPSNTQIQEIFVNHQNVIARDEGAQKIAIPIPKKQKSHILVKYEQKQSSSSEGIKLDGIKVDIRVTNVYWQLLTRNEFDLSLDSQSSTFRKYQYAVIINNQLSELFPAYSSQYTYTRDLISLDDPMMSIHFYLSQKSIFSHFKEINWIQLNQLIRFILVFFLGYFVFGRRHQLKWVIALLIPNELILFSNTPYQINEEDLFTTLGLGFILSVLVHIFALISSWMNRKTIEYKTPENDGNP